MADVQQLPQTPAPKLKTNQGHISGKIKAQRTVETQEGKLYLTVLILPSVGEYAHPSTVEVRSSHKLGNNGDEYSAFVSLRGITNNYEITNKKTSEVNSIISARNELQVLEN